MNTSNPPSPSAVLKPHQALLLFGVLALIAGAVVPLAHAHFGPEYYVQIRPYSITSAFWTKLEIFPYDYGLRIVSLLFWPTMAVLAYALVTAQARFRRFVEQALLLDLIAVVGTFTLTLALNNHMWVSSGRPWLAIHPSAGLALLGLGGVLVLASEVVFYRAQRRGQAKA